MSTLHFLQYDDFYRRVERDIEKTGEIADYADCVRQSTRYLESRGFEGKEIVPILVTSDLRPMSLESVREWSADIGIVNIIPNVQIIQAKKMDEFPFD